MSEKKKPARNVAAKDDMLSVFRELAAQKKIMQALAKLSYDDRIRALRAAAIMHGFEIFAP